MKTTRTYLRPFVPGDIKEAYQWFSNPEVMKYTPTGIDATIKTTEKRIEHYIDHQKEYGFSKYIVIDSTTREAIGDAGVLWSDELKGFELGFRLMQDIWNRGYGTEIASAWVRKMEDYRVISLLAFTHEKNTASRRVLEKCGFWWRGKQVIMGMESLVYRYDYSA